MSESIAIRAIQSALNSQQTFCKFLSANDTGATGGHQAGILISKSAWRMLFSHALDDEIILKRTIRINWHDDITTDSCFTYYRSKNELRVTCFGRGFPYLTPFQTGALFVLTRQSEDYYSAFILETEDSIERFLDAFGISPTETNRLVQTGRAIPQAREEIAIQEFIQGLTTEFPLSNEMSAAARSIHTRIYDHEAEIQTNPDRKIIEWTNMEYSLFRALEFARYGEKITTGFSSVEDFIDMANMVLNRRKSRAGKSLEHHLSALFDGNHIEYSSQAVTEGKKRPDFIFPSQMAYQDAAFSVDKLVTLAAKTTCKDRWRQVLNEADRLRHKPKFLCTLQQGISPAQMDEMAAENVTLVVPRDFIKSYPRDRQNRIWTIQDFINYIKEIENI